MKKFLPIILVLALLGGAGYFLMGKKTAPANQARPTPSPQEKTGGAINSIKDAMMGMQPIECVYADENGNQITARVKGENIKVSGYAASETGTKGNALIKGNTMYIWEEGTASGMMLTYDKETAAGQEGNKKDEMVQNLDKYKDNCKSGGFSDSVFEVPGDVKFTTNNVGTNNDAGQALNQADLEKMMEQYKR